MINKTEVYKIKHTALTDRGARIYGEQAWVHGFNGDVKVGGSGKTFTDKKIVNRMFAKIQSKSDYGTTFKCEIVTFKLQQIAVSDEEI